MRSTVLGLKIPIMSSHNDIEAKYARLQALLKIEQEESATRIRELQQKVTDLRLELHLAAEKPKDPAPQPTVSTGSSDPVLRAEISQLQQVLASKDAVIASRDREILLKDADIASRDMEISLRDADIELKNAEIETKDAEIETLCRNTSDLIESVKSYKNGLRAMTREMDRNGEAAAAVIDNIHPKESTPKIEGTDADRSSKQASTSPPKDVKDEGETKPKTPSSNSAPKDVKGEVETKPKTPSFGATSTKVPANAAPARPESAKPNYSQVLQAPNPGPVFPKGTLPPGNPRGVFFGGQKASVFPKTLPPSTPGGGFFGGQTGPVSPKTFPPATPQGGFFGGQTGQQQAVSSPFNQKQSVHSDRFPKHETLKERTDQSGREDRGPEKASTSKPQMGQEAPVYEDKTNLNRVNPDAASYALNTPGTVLDKKGGPWTAKMVEFGIRVGGAIPPDVMVAYESGALRVPETKVSSNPWGASWPKSVNPPTSRPETGEAGPSKAALEDDKVVPNPEQSAIHEMKLTPFQQMGQFGTLGSIFPSTKSESKSTSESSRAHTSTTMTDERKAGAKPSTTAEYPAMKSGFQQVLGQEAGESPPSPKRQKTGHPAPTSQAGVPKSIFQSLNLDFNPYLDDDEEPTEHEVRRIEALLSAAPEEKPTGLLWQPNLTFPVQPTPSLDWAEEESEPSESNKRL